MAFEREQQAKSTDSRDVDAAMRRWDAEHGRGGRGTIHTLIDHIEHMIEVAGVDHVGIGSDYDGVSMLPEQLEDVSTYPYITQALLDRGHASEDIRKILGGNMLRVMRGAEETARRMAVEAKK
jgi:membrane dipeptidase